MANIKTSFLGTEESETNEHELQCFANFRGEIFMKIDMGEDFEDGFICLDLSTSIKLHKTLRAEINKAKGVVNG